jgi:hypothetical protein
MYLAVWMNFPQQSLRIDTKLMHPNPEFVENQSQVKEIACNKDTGGLKAFHSWSRGVFFIVSAGGHIEYWQPLYRYRLVLLLDSLTLQFAIQCDQVW